MSESSNENPTHVVYVTVGDSTEALGIAHRVVRERLAACANLLGGVTSVYEWKDEVHEDPECILVLKTKADRLSALIDRVVQLHSYECPCVTSWPIQQGNSAFLEWIGEQTRARRDG